MKIKRFEFGLIVGLNFSPTNQRCFSGRKDALWLGADPKKLIDLHVEGEKEES